MCLQGCRDVCDSSGTKITGSPDIARRRHSRREYREPWLIPERKEEGEREEGREGFVKRKGNGETPSPLRAPNRCSRQYCPFGAEEGRRGGEEGEEFVLVGLPQGYADHVASLV